jgi:deoxyuridine 5'-triphosphate nucleotidohydrolase
MWPFGRKKPKVIWHVPEGRDDLIPRRATCGSIAYDLVSPTSIVIPRFDPNLGVGSALINTLVAASLPPGYGMLFRSRSGLANKKGVTVEAGEIDSDYRGLLRVLLFNHSGADYVINAGDRIAQARIVKVEELNEEILYEYPDQDETERGGGGFGSTGK